MKLARALIAIANQTPPLRRFIAGADAIGTAEQKVAELKEQIEALRGLSSSLAFDVGQLAVTSRLHSRESLGVSRARR